MIEEQKKPTSSSGEGFDAVLKEEQDILERKDEWKEKARETLDRLNEDQESDEISLNEGE